MKPTLVIDHTLESFLLHWLVLEKECPLDVVNVGHGYTSRHVRAPYYEDGEVVVYDHNTLVQFLQERYPGITLLPADPILRAQVRQACTMVRDNNLDMASEIEEILRFGSAYMGGREFGLLDVYVGTWLSEYVMDHEISTRVAEYWKRISNRPAFRIADS